MTCFAIIHVVYNCEFFKCYFLIFCKLELPYNMKFQTILKCAKNKKFEYTPTVHDWLKFDITFLVVLYYKFIFCIIVKYVFSIACKIELSYEVPYHFKNVPNKYVGQFAYHFWSYCFVIIDVMYIIMRWYIYI